MAPLGDREYKVDLLIPLSWGMHLWIVTFGIWSMASMFVCYEFFSIKTGYWISMFLGIPASTIFAFGLAGIVWFFRKAHRPPEESRMDMDDLKAAQKKINRSCIVGAIATVTALFTHYNPTGEARDFSPTNILDAAITATLTFGLYKKNLGSAVLILIYFIVWKMALWSHNQPRAMAFAGIVMAVFFWQGIVGIIRERRWNERKRS